MYRFLLSLALLFSAVTNSAGISNFEFGLACTDGKTFAWICHEQDVIYVSGQGRCIYDGNEKPCTWFGYRFEYKGFEEDTVLKCTFKKSARHNMGNPFEETATNIDSATYELDVGVGDGVFTNPQYAVLHFSDRNEPPESTHTFCTLDGENVLDFEYELIFPAKPPEEVGE